MRERTPRRRLRRPDLDMQPWDETYVDDGELRPQDDVPLERFLAQSDRAALKGTGTPFFSGRDAYVNTFRGAARALAIGEKPNATVIVEGPPGCGKSALLEQFSADVGNYPEHDGRTWIAVPINGAIAMSPRGIMGAVDRAIVTRLANTATGDEGALGRLSKLLQIGDPNSALDAAKAISDRGIAAFGFSIGKKDKQPPRHMEDLVDLRGKQWNEWNIVLMIDEAQHISADGTDSHAGTLSSIHQGLVQIPIMFCAFGLQGTVAALKSVGVSRPACERDVYPLGLADEHVDMAVQRAFRQYDVRDGGELAHTIVKRTGGWPQHLAVYLRAALDKAKPQIKAREPVDASTLDMKDILSEGDRRRESYYRSRIESLAAEEPVFMDYAEGLARSLRRAKQPLSASEMLRLVIDEHGASEHDANRFLKGARQCGLVATDQNRRYFSPIPSFLTYLAGSSRPPEPPRPKRGGAGGPPRP